MYKLKIGSQDYDLSEDDIQAADLISSGTDELSIIQGHKSYTVKCIARDLDTKTYQVEIDGQRIDVAIEDEYDQLIDQLGFSREEIKIIKDVKAPMPGLLLELLVQPGDEVETGSPLLILEAMKMENVIKAQGVGVVKQILVSKATPVEKGQILIEME